MPGSASRHSARHLVALVVFGALIGTTPATATVDGELEFHRGVAAFAEGKLDEAEGRFRSVLEADPEDTAALRYLGLIAQARGDSQVAVETLRRAVATDPEDLEARIDLAEALLQAGMTPEALREADFVLARDADDARANLYAGIAHYRSRHYEEALQHLERASELDESLRVQARYYVGLAEAFLGDFGSAAGAFSDVEEGSPQSPLGRSAQELGERVAPDRERWWAADASAGLEFDSNPEVVNDDFEDADPDGSGVFRLRGSGRAPDWKGIRARAGYDGYLNAHFDVTSVDQQTHQLWAGASWARNRFELGARYDFAYTLLPLDEEFRQVHRATPSASLRWGDWGITQLYYVFNHYEYYNVVTIDSDGDGDHDEVAPEFDRDGDQHSIGANQFIFLPESLRPLSYARVGVSATSYMPDGDEYEYDGIQALVGGGLELPFEIGLTTFYRFIYRDYANTSEIEDEKREDNLHWLSLDLSYPLARHWTLGLSGSFLFNDSNIDLFQYDRQIVSSYVRYSF